MQIAAVIVNKSARVLDKLFHYMVPESLSGKLSVGMAVSVPFGKNNAPTEGYIVGFPQETDAQNLKEIQALLEPESFFDENMLEIIQFMRHRYFATYLSAVKTVVPYGLGLRSTTGSDKILRGSSLALSQDEAFEALEAARNKAPVQAKIIELLLQNDFVANSDIQMLLSCSPAAIKALENKGVIRPMEIEVFRNPINYDTIPKTKPLVPKEEQQQAIDMISENLSAFGVFLLHGVTGSGKTEIFLQCINRVLKQGKTAIVLVPEISLTPQTIRRFAGRFGKQIAVLHSRLSLGERNDEYKRIRSGEARVVIGVRSAVFAPLQNLGLIVVDEEHEASYKSQNVPAYHTIEIAELRAKQNGIPLILASATPSVESFYKAQTGQYRLITLHYRANDRDMPKVSVVDMRKELAEGNRSLFSETLKREIQLNLENGQQTILFLNRRGFSTFVSCRSCGYVAKCPRCNISLTYHKNKDFLTCHYCGYTMHSLSTCPECGSKYIRHFGTGTQKIEEELKEIFPNINVLRMDLDTVSAKNSHQKILDRFESEKADVLIGTQMVTKGLDYENVTLVGVLAADMSLNVDDYRANEKTFDLLTQVCGRAGRGAQKGRAVIQTYMPDHPVISLAKTHDFCRFYQEEISLRKALVYPPFCDLITIIFSSFHDGAATMCSKKIAKELREILQNQNKIEILGPSSCGFYKMNNKYRKRILIKCELNDTIIQVLSECQERHVHAKESRSVNMIIETNPVHIL